MCYFREMEVGIPNVDTTVAQRLHATHFHGPMAMGCGLIYFLIQCHYCYYIIRGIYRFVS